MVKALQQKLAEAQRSAAYWQETAQRFRRTRDEFGWRAEKLEQELGQAWRVARAYKAKAERTESLSLGLAFLCMILGAYLLSLWASRQEPSPR